MPDKITYYWEGLLKINYTMEAIWKFILVGTISFLAPLNGIMIAMTLVVMFDVVTGVYAAWKEGQLLTSSKLGNVIPKLFLYNLTVLCVYLLDLHLLGEFSLFFTDITLFATKITGMSIFLVEFSSIINNLERGLNIRFLKIFRKWKSVIGKEVSDVKDIASDVNSTVDSIRRAGKEKMKGGKRGNMFVERREHKDDKDHGHEAPGETEGFTPPQY